MQHYDHSEQSCYCAIKNLLKTFILAIKIPVRMAIAHGRGPGSDVQLYLHLQLPVNARQWWWFIQLWFKQSQEPMLAFGNWTEIHPVFLKIKFFNCCKQIRSHVQSSYRNDSLVQEGSCSVLMGTAMSLATVDLETEPLMEESQDQERETRKRCLEQLCEGALKGGQAFSHICPPL